MADCINYGGISTNLPVNIKYFKEELFDNIFSKKGKSQPIDEIVSATVDSKIHSVKLLNTPVRTSNEGKKLTGKKLLVELTLSYNIKYTTNSLEKYLYILKNDVTKIIYIVVPKEIDDNDIDDFLRKKKIQIQSYINDLYVEKRNEDNVYVRTLMLLNANVKS
ncbi:MAG: hypothetical protein ACRC3Y_06680 [Romboutsia sp.]|uniref:hypothetical protein n=1 Tax=Romboutsia sp. TaxID=1965302 RepID=UPI003F35E891